MAGNPLQFPGIAVAEAWVDTKVGGQATILSLACPKVRQTITMTGTQLELSNTSEPVSIVGPTAGDMISEAALAIEMGARLEDIALTIHPHPTLGETMMEAAEAALGHAIHIIQRPLTDRKELRANA